MITKERAVELFQNSATDASAAIELTLRLLRGETVSGMSPHDEIPPEDVVVQAIRSESLTAEIRNGILEGCRRAAAECLKSVSIASRGQAIADSDRKIVERLSRVIELTACDQLRPDALAMMAYTVHGAGSLGLLAWDIVSAYSAYDQETTDARFWELLGQTPEFRKFSQRQLLRCSSAIAKFDLDIDSHYFRHTSWAKFAQLNATRLANDPKWLANGIKWEKLDVSQLSRATVRIVNMMSDQVFDSDRGMQQVSGIRTTCKRLARFKDDICDFENFDYTDFDSSDEISSYQLR